MGEDFGSVQDRHTHTHARRQTTQAQAHTFRTKHQRNHTHIDKLERKHETRMHACAQTQAHRHTHTQTTQLHTHLRRTTTRHLHIQALNSSPSRVEYSRNQQLARYRRNVTPSLSSSVPSGVSHLGSSDNVILLKPCSGEQHGAK